MEKLLAVLGLQAFVFHNNFWGNGDAFVKLDNKQLEMIEAALEKEEPEAKEIEGGETIKDLQAKVSGFEATETEVQEALTAALTLNGLATTEGQSVAEAIATLGAKCKEYGDSKETHSIIKNDGLEKPSGDGLQNGYYDPNALHNKI